MRSRFPETHRGSVQVNHDHAGHYPEDRQAEGQHAPRNPAPVVERPAKLIQDADPRRAPFAVPGIFPLDLDRPMMTRLYLQQRFGFLERLLAIVQAVRLVDVADQKRDLVSFAAGLIQQR
jgi:hypothetical protein